MTSMMYPIGQSETRRLRVDVSPSRINWSVLLRAAVRPGDDPSAEHVVSSSTAVTAGFRVEASALELTFGSAAIDVDALADDYRAESMFGC